MTLIITPTLKSGHPEETLYNVKSLHWVGTYTVEVEFKYSGKVERFYAIEDVRSMS